MILAFDTYYFDGKAKTVGLVFESWSSHKPSDIFEETIESIAIYESGSFYKRELPCILSLLKKISVLEVESIIVDGFVFLDDNGKLGLGGHLFEQLGKVIPVIGVAKSKFHGIDKNCRALFRGSSKNPLFITAVGLELEVAVDCLKMMYGDFRMPYLLQLLDSKTKERPSGLY